MDLDPAAAAAGVRLLIYDTLASTNAECLARARANERGPLWITAHRQTAGRGRRGRSFISERGNLYASLLLTNACPPSSAAELSFVAALALHDALAKTATALLPRLALKWPNDVLCDQRKLAGILIEGETLPGGALATVVGIGLNCAHHPEGMVYPATDLATAGAPVLPRCVLRALSGTMLQRLLEWDRGRAFALTRTAWLARAFGVGKPVRILLSDRQLEGRFECLDEAGRLLLRREDGSIELISAGDVFPIDPPDVAAQRHGAAASSGPTLSPQRVPKGDPT
jgi:BirA family biotin operon repressor/biotin-[acetyl-CoA-carboxylase] ligase